jgi:methyltransferase (TIGR00027 family)
MKQNESSVTSLITAFARAYHSLNDTPKIFDDYLAKELISQNEFSDISQNLIRGISYLNPEIGHRFQDQPDEMLKWIAQIQLSPITLARSSFSDNVIKNELKLGLKQYVVLGAGLDTFCFRHPDLKNTLEIFEVDYPATQEFKKQRLEDANFSIPNNLHFVPMDFTKKFSGQILLEKGFANIKTTYSLLGVSYYLSKEEISRLLDEIFTIVPSGSSIVFDYADERLFEEKGMFNRVDNMVKMAAGSGEPMKSCFSYDEMESLLEKSGLLIYEHLTPAEIQQTFFHSRSDYLSAFETIHFIHAVKR